MARYHPSQSYNLNVSAKQLDDAYQHVCRERRHFPANADIWRLRRDWPSLKAELLVTINRGEYKFSALNSVCKDFRQIIHVWTSEDAIVIKVLTDVLQTKLSLSPAYTHVKGHGGLKHCVAEVQRQLDDYRFVCKTDVKGYYESIDQYTLLNLIADQVPDRLLRRYCYQIVHRSLENQQIAA